MRLEDSVVEHQYSDEVIDFNKHTSYECPFRREKIPFNDQKQPYKKMNSLLLKIHSGSI